MDGWSPKKKYSIFLFEETYCAAFMNKKSGKLYLDQEKNQNDVHLSHKLLFLSIETIIFMI